MAAASKSHVDEQKSDFDDLKEVFPTKIVIKQRCQANKFITVDIKRVDSPFQNLKLHILTTST